MFAVPEGDFKYTGTVYRDMALRSLPLQSLLEFGLSTESMEINLLSIKIIGMYNSVANSEQIEAF